MSTLASHEESFVRIAVDLGLLSASRVEQLSRTDQPLARQLVLEGLLTEGDCDVVFARLREELDRDDPGRHDRRAEETLARLAVEEGLANPDDLAALANSDPSDSLLESLFPGGVDGETLLKLRQLRERSYVGCALCGDDVERSAIDLDGCCPTCGFVMSANPVSGLHDPVPSQLPELDIANLTALPVSEVPQSGLKSPTSDFDSRPTERKKRRAAPTEPDSDDELDSLAGDDPMVGRVLGGKVEIVRRLGAGGMGTVYLGFHRTLEIEVAVKILPSQLALRPEFIERFQREARSAAKLQHPNIVRVIDLDSERSLSYIVMEFVEGKSAGQRLRDEGPMTLGEALRIVGDAASGLAAAHEAGVIHRDIKPDNIMISHAGETKIADFGLARMAANSNISRTGAVMGSPAYMAPEQVRGETADAKTDIYSLGVTFYALLAGKSPFQKDNALASMMATADAPIPDISQVDTLIPTDVGELIDRMAAKDPANRFPSMLSVMMAIEKLEAELSDAPLDQLRRRPAAMKSTAELPTAQSEKDQVREMATITHLPDGRGPLRSILIVLTVFLTATAGGWYLAGMPGLDRGPGSTQAGGSDVGPGSQVDGGSDDAGSAGSDGSGSDGSGSDSGSGSQAASPSRRWIAEVTRQTAKLGEGSTPEALTAAWKALALPADSADWDPEDLTAARRWSARTRAMLKQLVQRKLAALTRNIEGADAKGLAARRTAAEALPTFDDDELRTAREALIRDTKVRAVGLRLSALFGALDAARDKPQALGAPARGYGELAGDEALAPLLGHGAVGGDPRRRELECAWRAHDAWARYLARRVGTELIVRRRDGSRWTCELVRDGEALVARVSVPVQRTLPAAELDPDPIQLADALLEDARIPTAERYLAGARYLLLAGAPKAAVVGRLLAGRAAARAAGGDTSEADALLRELLPTTERGPRTSDTPPWWRNRAAVGDFTRDYALTDARELAELGWRPVRDADALLTVADDGPRRARHADGAIALSGATLLWRLPGVRLDAVRLTLTVRGGGLLTLAAGDARWVVRRGERGWRSELVRRAAGARGAAAGERAAWLTDDRLTLELARAGDGWEARTIDGDRPTVRHRLLAGGALADSTAGATWMLATSGGEVRLEAFQVRGALTSLDAGGRERDRALEDLRGRIAETLDPDRSRILFAPSAPLRARWEASPADGWSWTAQAIVGRQGLLSPRGVGRAGAALLGIRYRSKPAGGTTPRHALRVDHGPTDARYRFVLPLSDETHALRAWLLPRGPIVVVDGVPLLPDVSALDGARRGPALEVRGDAPLEVVGAAWRPAHR